VREPQEEGFCETVQPDLLTNAEGVACYKGVPLMTSAGPVRAPDSWPRSNHSVTTCVLLTNVSVYGFASNTTHEPQEPQDMGLPAAGMHAPLHCTGLHLGHVWCRFVLMCLCCRSGCFSCSQQGQHVFGRQVHAFMLAVNVQTLMLHTVRQQFSQRFQLPTIFQLSFFGL